MASGYEKHKDYGGKEPLPLEILLIVLALVIVSLVLFVW
jgi:hypothetical protein